MKPTGLLATALVLVTLFINCRRSTDTPAAPVSDDPVVNFLRAHPTRSALSLIRNDTLLVSLRADQKMPLASTVKTIVAIEFAKQVAAGRINPQEQVPISDIDRFYIPNTDGGAHPAWKAALTGQNLINNSRVPLLEVGKGMIRFSSNANTDYLLDRLGFDAVNANLSALNLSRHDQIIPLGGALMLYSTTDKNATLSRIRAMSAQEYATQAMALHQRLKNDADGSFKNQFVFPDMELQKLWSDRLPASTTAEYVSVMQKISKRGYFAPAVQTPLDQIMEWPMSANPANQRVYQHLGMKGGSTAFVLTMAAYATTTAGDRTQLAVFFNDLSLAEQQTLTNNLNSFLINCIQQNRYRQTVSDLLQK